MVVEGSAVWCEMREYMIEDIVEACYDAGSRCHDEEIENLVSMPQLLKNRF